MKMTSETCELRATGVCITVPTSTVTMYQVQISTPWVCSSTQPHVLPHFYLQAGSEAVAMIRVTHSGIPQHVQGKKDGSSRSSAACPLANLQGARLLILHPPSLYICIEEPPRWLHPAGALSSTRSMAHIGFVSTSVLESKDGVSYGFSESRDG